MYEIQANTKGSRHLSISDEHLETIRKYALFQGLVSSTGFIDEMALEKLRMNVRALIETHQDNSDLLNFCKEVLYHDNMKAFGLQQLLSLYTRWYKTYQESKSETNDNNPAE